MRSPLYYKKHGCGQIMTSHRRRGPYGFMGNPTTGEFGWVNEDGDKRHIEHHCPVCDITQLEPTDSEWRSEGKELDLGTYGGIE